jgi:hypothetical protein
MLLEDSFKCKVVAREAPKPCDVTASGNVPRNSEMEIHRAVLDLSGGFRY